jgi:hypothetical protein
MVPQNKSKGNTKQSLASEKMAYKYGKKDPLLKKRIEIIEKYGLDYGEYPLDILQLLLKNGKHERTEEELEHIRRLIKIKKTG